jgi:phosphoglycerate dehydrogenase-like enzyme
MNLWIPEQPGHEALGEVLGGVICHRFPASGPLPQAIGDAEFLVPSQHSEELLELLPKMEALRVVQTLSAGIDWLAELVPSGVTLCDAAGARDVAVAEWVLAAILSTVKLVGEMRDRQREHRWRWSEPDDLAGKRVTILGYGSIGAAVEARLQPFAVEVVRVARRARSGVHAVADLPELLEETDVLVVLLPLTAATEGLLDGGLLARLPEGALLVNASRGAILDTEALLGLLEEERVKAVLDVTSPEPLPPGHPLWDAKGVLITPHMAGDSPLAQRRAWELVGEQVRRYARGEALVNVVQGAY